LFEAAQRRGRGGFKVHLPGEQEHASPMASDDLACALEAEAGREYHFCPISGLPILRGQRVRALPGFHLLSLDAGKEALARGFYDAFGQQFPCQNLEYLHPEDKVFICAEDDKVFLNQMSMQYHRYIRHELEERKAERKRLRARAVERKARSEAHAAQVHQRQQAQQDSRQQVQQQAQPQPQPQTQRLQARVEAGAAAVEGASAAALAGADAAAQLLATNELEPADEPFTATDDPYAAATGEDPYLEAASAFEGAGAPAAGPGLTAAGAAAAVGTTDTPARAAAAERLADTTGGARLGTQQPATAAAKHLDVGNEEEDLYGDIGDREAKRQRTSSAYANAIGAILDNDFDDDD